MTFRFRSAAVLCLASTMFPALGAAQHYTQKNLVADTAQPANSDGSAVAVDPNLINPWGLTRSATSPFWINNNNHGSSSLYGFANGAAVPIDIFNGGTQNFVVVPPPPFEPSATSAPTGVVFNGNAKDFLLDKGTPANLPAVFMFVTEDGTISGWNPGANATPGVPGPSTNAVLEVDNSDHGNGAVYKGATLGVMGGQTFLYVTNFRAGRVEVYDSSFHRKHLGEEAFDDDSVPRGLSPFNIQNIGGSLFVTYAKPDAARADEIFGPGLGFVSIFTPEGRLIGHLQHGPWFNSPWGVVWTPRDFGVFSNSILVGNFGSGWIAAFNGFTHEFLGFVLPSTGTSPLFIDGVWSLTFGNDGTAGPATTLFFTAGPNHQADGLFGTLLPVKTEEDGSVE